MKKVLSIVLALALVLTALALPMSVSAATVEGKLTVSFDINDGSAAAINPGDTVKVDVVATAAEAAYNLNYWTVDVSYDKNNLEFVTPDPANENIVDLGGIVRIINEGTETEIATGGTDIAALNFKVKDTAPASTTITFSTDVNDTGFAQINGTTGNINKYAYTTTPASFTVAENTSSVTVDGVAINNGATYYKGTALSVVVTAEKATSITIKEAAAEEATTLTSGAAHSVEADGTYTITVVMPGKTDIYTFTYVADEIEASLEVVTTDKKAAGYTTADQVTAVVKLAGLADGAQAAMVKFALDYDDAKLALVSATGDEIELGEDGIITYGVTGAATGTGNTEALATLTFDVVDSAAYGDVTFAIKAGSTDLALVTTMVNPTGTPVEIAGSTQTVTIVPATDDAYYSGTGNPDGVDVNAWKAEAYTYGVEAAADTIELKYIESTSAITEVTESSFITASALDDGGILIDAEANYYLVAKVGSVYKLVTTLNNGTEVFFDETKPSITGAENANMADWTNEDATIDLAGVSFTDALSQVKEITYTYGETTGTYDPEAGSTIIVEAPEEGVLETLTLKVVDKAGNEATADVTLKIDTVIPTVELTPGTQSGGKVEITIVANDNKALDTVKAYYSPEALEEPVTTDAIEALEVVEVAENKITAGKNGVYYVVVADKATNKAYDFETVTLATISEASDIKVQVVNDAEFIAGFLNTTDMAAKGIKKDAETVIDSNGTFTQIAITVNDAAPGYANDVKLYNETDLSTPVEYTLGEVLSTAGNYQLKVKTSNTTDTSVYAEETYKFSIVAPADMISPDGNKRYNIFDFAMIKTLVGSSEVGVLPTADNEFVGGLFSGDMTGDLTMTAADFGAILNSLRAGETPGAYYNLPIMNQEIPGVEE